MGAGWLETEHGHLRLPVPRPPGKRFGMLEEQIEIVRREWEGEDRLTFEGETTGSRVSTRSPSRVYAPPKPDRRRPSEAAAASRLAARWANEYNLVMMGAEECAEAIPNVRAAWDSAGHGKPTISLMAGCIIGSDEVDLLERAHAVAEARGEEAPDPEAYLNERPPNTLTGTVAEVRQQLAELEELGVERVMLQYLTHRDLDGVTYIAELAG